MIRNYKISVELQLWLFFFLEPHPRNSLSKVEFSLRAGFWVEEVIFTLLFAPNVFLYLLSDFRFVFFNIIVLTVLCPKKKKKTERRIFCFNGC